MLVVYLDDSKIVYDRSLEYFQTAADWAKAQCQSFVDYHVQDVSDASIMFDHVAEYRFRDSRDALMFQLKWKSN